MEQTSREAWAKRVERWKDSGLSAKEYAAEVGINARSLSWWSWHLGTEKRGGLRPTRRRRRVAVQPKAPAPITFVEMTAPSAAEPLEVVLPSGIRIRVPVTVDTGMLARVLDVLEKRR
jgi:hypothetical protein